jgi:hypothetical protein
MRAGNEPILSAKTGRVAEKRSLRPGKIERTGIATGNGGKWETGIIADFDFWDFGKIGKIGMDD